MKNLLLHILNALVQYPGDLDITQVDGGQTTFFELRCHPDDVGIVIGKNGKTISAIRVLLNSLAGRDDRQVVIEVIEPVN
jgi:predicted RNA-binding protein YlqC (UPF0109 family)